jgi:tetratricopeptide (TPR) repeat protein
MQETDAVLKKDSLNLRFLHIKAQLYYLAKDTPNSIKTYEKAIDIFPEPGDLMDLGTLYAATKNPKALELADALLLAKKANADKEALFLKGLYFNYTGDKQKAIIFFDDCLHLDYTFMFAYREKAIALYDLGKYNEALKVLNKATTLQNGFDEGYYWAGRCLEKLNRLSDAIDSYRMALQVAANNDDDNMEAREALARLGLKEQ